MAKMLAKLFEALRSIGVDEKVAQAAAEEAAGVDEKVGELKLSFESLRSEVRIFQAITGLIFALLLTVGGLVMNLIGTVNRLDERMIGFDKRLGAVETKLAGIEATLGEIRGLITKISTDVAPDKRSELSPSIANDTMRQSQWKPASQRLPSFDESVVDEWLNARRDGQGFSTAPVEVRPLGRSGGADELQKFGDGHRADLPEFNPQEAMPPPRR